jgi:hypothetical protein
VLDENLVTSEASAQIAWMDIDPKAKLIAPRQISSDQPLVLRLYTAALNISEIDYTWSSVPPLAEDAQADAGSDHKIWILPDKLDEGRLYVFRVVAKLKESGQIIFDGAQPLRVIAP